MKSTVSNNPCTKAKPYPKLMTATTGSGLIVLFDKPERGVCVVAGETGNKEGKYYTSWLGEEHWKDFNGSVCLEND